jgi:transcriptional regulator with XRE-family HTH domain
MELTQPYESRERSTRMRFPSTPDYLNHLPRFGDQLRDYRTLRGLSIEEVAEGAGIAPGALRDMEVGRRAAPSEDIAASLANALHLSKQERETFLEAAEMESPMLNALLGRQPARPAQPTMTAMILAFLIADIRGYTRFTQEQGDEAAARLTARFAALAREAVERWDGQLVEVRGDEILAVFACPRDSGAVRRGSAGPS